MSKSLFDADATNDYPLEFNTYAQLEAYAEAYADRVAFSRGEATEMHLVEPRMCVRPPALPQAIFPVRKLPPVPACLDLGGKFSPF